MLEIKVTLHGVDGSVAIAHMHITQVAQGEGSLRDYRIDAMRMSMRDPQIVYTDGARVLGHDRELPVWELIAKACKECK